MKKVIINAVAGIGLFAGTLVGTLAATGRLNHAGTAGIPMLGSLFPAPPEPAEGEPQDAGKDGVAHGVSPSEATASKQGGHAAEASGSPQGKEPPAGLERLRIKDANPPPGKAEGEGGGHGGGEKPAAGAHGESSPPAEPHATQESPTPHVDQAAATVEQDFKTLHEALRDEPNAYRPGQLFEFRGMPAGVTPTELDLAWKRVQEIRAELDKEKAALELRERDLVVREQDVADRQNVLGAERTRIESMMKELDNKLADFKQQVTIVQADEAPALQRNAETLASFGAQKGAELVQEQWKTEAGQKQVLKLLTLMETDKVDKLLAALPNAMVLQIQEQLLHVSVEKPKGGKSK